MPAQTPGLAALDEYLDALDARVDSTTELLAEQAAQIGALTDRVAALEAASSVVEAPIDPETPEEPLPEPEPEPTTPEGDLQFRTYDGASGPNRQYWNQGVKLRWKNDQVGDWRDANSEPQGAVPFATASIPNNGRGPHDWDVTELVRKQLASANRGFFLQAAGTAFRFPFVGRRGADVAARPVLRVVTDEGEFECPAVANAQWALNSYGTSDRSAQFGPQKDQSHCIIQFDYSQIRGDVQSAVMTLHATGDKIRAGSVSVFEADPPAYQMGRGPTTVEGLSAAYPADRGIAEHPAVIFASDFTDDEGKPSFSGWRVSSDRQPNLMLDPETGLPFHRRVFKPGDFEPDGEHGNVLLAQGLSDYGHEAERVVEQCNFRYRVRLGEDWRSTVDDNKMPGFRLSYGFWRQTASGGYWQQVSGNGGVKGDGKLKPNARGYNYPSWDAEGRAGGIVAHHGHMTRGHGGRYWPGNPLSERFVWLGTYLYHIDQAGFYGDNLRWREAVLERGRWHDIEQRIRVNSLTGPADYYGNREPVADGEYAVWLDGVEVYRRSNLRWRCHPETGVESIWTGWYHGGKYPVNREMTVDVGNFVVATEYIGPVKL